MVRAKFRCQSIETRVGYSYVKSLFRGQVVLSLGHASSLSRL